MRIAAPSLLAQFPGACTPHETSGNHPVVNQPILLPLLLNNRRAGDTTDTAESILPTADRPAIPLDPSLVATPLDNHTTFGESIAFLYSGNHPLQTGVITGAIDQGQVSVVRGKVLAADGQPLPGVTVQLFGHREYGQTTSRNDGLFDLAVNTGPLTVCFELPGYLPAQRQVNATWNDFTVLDDVVLLPMDNLVSTIDLNNSSEMQVAQGSPIGDDDGERRATLLFAPSTSAEMVLADGSTRPLSTLNVRASEYTVGETGAQAMPGDLPPASGYTYAVEFSVDEALRAGAVDVRFTRPVINYVENFLGFPVGTPVPTGYYDRGRSAWVPSDNGRVISILAIDGGLAMLDVNGSGQIASTQQLAALGIDQAEQQTLAELYQPGQSLWRVPIPHFTPWDHNWPYGPPDDAIAPNAPYPQPDTPQAEPCKRRGSLIECQNQTLGEHIKIAGTPFSLNYRSSRTPARQLGNRVTIALTGSTVPASLKGVVLETEIAGQLTSLKFGPAPNQLYDYRWDGKDAFGRPTAVGRRLTVRLGFVYRAVYRTPGEEFQRSFASFGGDPISGDIGRGELTIWRTWQTVLQGRSWDARTQALGGWTLEPHHAYDLDANTLHRGDGVQLTARYDGRVLRTVAGVYGSGGAAMEDGRLANEVAIGAPVDIVAGPDGTLYFSSHPGCVYKIDRQGRIYRVPRGADRQCLVSVDGLPGPIILNPSGLALAPNGDLYVVNHGANGQSAHILRFRPDGAVFWVAGNGQVGFAGDGGPATEATFYGPTDVAVAPDGSLYIADFYNQRVRRVGTDGVVTTVAGGGEPAAGLGDGGPATAAKLGHVRTVAVDQAGVLYIGHDHQGGAGVRVRRVGGDGIITTVVGGGSKIHEEGELGTETALSTVTRVLTVGPDNNLYLDDGHRIRMLSQDGHMLTVAGTKDYGYAEDGTPLDEAKLAYPAVAFTPAGVLYLAELNNGVIRVANPNLSNLIENEFLVASSDGSEIFVFDRDGRHRRTVNALTGATRYIFGYDAQNRLVTVTDALANTTRVERNDVGAPTAIVSPFGQRTLLGVDEHGYLTSVTDPANGSYHMTYHDAGGLLASFTDPNGNTNQFSYDDGGRLLQDSFATQGGWTLAQLGTAAGLSVTVSSALQRTTTLAMVDHSTAFAQRSITFPDGTHTVMTVTLSGGYQTHYADGTVVESRFQPDTGDGFNPWFAGSTVRLPSGLQTQIDFARTRRFNVGQAPLSGVATVTSTTTVNQRTITSVYDGATKTTTDTSAAGRRTTSRYDDFGRLIEQSGEGLAPVTYRYNQRGLMTGVQIGAGETARIYKIDYDEQGEPSAFINPAGQRSNLTVDPVGRMTAFTRPDGAVTTFAHDANGNLTSITPPGRPAHTFTYNAQNQMTAYTPPAVDGGNTTTTYAYNLDGQLTTLTRPDASVVALRYDAAGRTAQVELGRGAIGYGYDSTTGQLNRITAPDGGVLRYKFDGPLLTESTWSGVVAGDVQRTYDDFRRVSRLTVGNQSVTYSYDADGLVTQAGALLIEYDEHGLPSGSTLSNIATATVFNSFGELANSRVTVAGDTLYDALYARDGVGRITHKAEVVDNHSVTFDYAYNEVGRLREVWQDGALVATYTYDANGNRLSGPGGATGLYDAQDRMTRYGNATYTYNTAGDLTTRSQAGEITSYTYDELSNLVAVGLPDGRAIGYVIDGNNRRIGKTVDGVLRQGFLYQDQLRIVAELDGSNHLVSHFVYADNSTTPAYMTRNGVVYRLVSDHLGSVRLVVNVTTGEIAQRLDYDAFGVVLADTNPGFQPFGFAGGLYDPDTGLVRFGKRDYDAQSGRWTTKDPLGMAGGDTNLYLYVGGDPVNLTDEGGDFFFLIGVLAAILLLSVMALPLAMKILKKWQERRNQQPEDQPLVRPPAPPQPCDQRPPPEPVPEPGPEPAAEPAPPPNPLPEQAPADPQPEPPIMAAPDYWWAESAAPPPCPSPAIRPPIRGTLCR